AGRREGNVAHDRSGGNAGHARTRPLPEPVAANCLGCDRHLFHLFDLFALGRSGRGHPLRDRADRLVLAQGAEAQSGAGHHMIPAPRFTDSVAELPTHKFGPSSLTWWGVVGFMVIEGAGFALAFAAYFFIMGHEQGWPPEGRQAPNLLWGTLFT